MLEIGAEMDISKLISLANYLDEIGLTKEAELIDNLIISTQSGVLDNDQDEQDEESE